MRSFKIPEQTNIYQSNYSVDGMQITYYYLVVEEYPRGYVRLRGLGRLWIGAEGQRVWSSESNHNPEHPDSPYPLYGKQRYWKECISLPGNGRIEDGRVLRTKHGGAERGRTQWSSLQECHPPPEYYTS